MILFKVPKEVGETSAFEGLRASFQMVPLTARRPPSLLFTCFAFLLFSQTSPLPFMLRKLRLNKISFPKEERNQELLRTTVQKRRGKENLQDSRFLPTHSLGLLSWDTSVRATRCLSSGNMTDGRICGVPARLVESW